MNRPSHRSQTSRRFFIGCAAASPLPILALGWSGAQGSLDSRLAECLKGFGGSSRHSGSVVEVRLHRNEWGGFFQMLTEKFPSPRIRENNLVELWADGQSLLLRVA